MGGAIRFPVCKAARDAIVARKDLKKSERADHLAVLRFVGEKENVAIAVLTAYISAEELMASTLYKTIFKKGLAEGKARGKAETYAELVVNRLIRHMGVVDPAVRQRIRKTSDLDVLRAWYDVVVYADVDTARWLVDQIRSASLEEMPAPLQGAELARSARPPIG